MPGWEGLASAMVGGDMESWVMDAYVGAQANLLYPAPAGNSPDPESLIQAQKPLLAS
jgi:hypothetical protein